MLHKETLEKIVGDGNVEDKSEILAEYSSDLSFAPRIRPSIIVRPSCADEVQKIVKWANETLTPLVPVSSGRPHFRGDTVPSIGGAVVVDLSRMDQVMRMDRRNRVCMVEPGVTFSELVPALEREGLRLNMPLLPRSTKSVIGSMLEREPVLMPLYQWDALDPLSCIEVIFGTGDLFRTGAAAGPGTLEEQWRAKQAQVNPMGPGQTDFARVVQGAQGTMGIVTWATVRCEALPTLQESFLAGADELEKLSDFIYRLIRLKLVNECLVLNNANVAAILSKEPEEYKILIPALPKWLLFFCLAGYEYFPEERLQYQQNDMIETAKHFGIEPLKAIFGVSVYKFMKILAKPSEEPYWKLRHRGACEDIFFLTTLNRVPEFVKVMHQTADQNGYTAPIGIYVQPMVQGTSCHCEFNLFYDPSNPTEVRKIQDLHNQASEALMNVGAFFSRPYGAWADTAYRRDGGTAAALKMVKQVFDPNNIMNSGKLCF